MQEVTNRLSELLDDHLDLSIERDEKRDLLTILLKHQNNTSIPARALSDGTLRFLALTILEADHSSSGVICLEEPENGIHPQKIPAMIKLLEDVACDPQFEANAAQGNPLRQVIINTHSPLVVQNVDENSLLVAEKVTHYHTSLEKNSTKVAFRPLHNTWRKSEQPVSIGKLIAYLQQMRPDEMISNNTTTTVSPTKKRVMSNQMIKEQLELF